MTFDPVSGFLINVNINIIDGYIEDNEVDQQFRRGQQLKDFQNDAAGYAKDEPLDSAIDN